MGNRWDDDELLAPKVTPLPPRGGSIVRARRAAGVAAVAIAMTGAGCSDRVASPTIPPMPAGDSGIDAGSADDAAIDSGPPSPMPPPIDGGDRVDARSPMPDSGPEDAGIDSAPSPMPALDSGVIAPMPPPPMPPPMPEP